MAEHKCGACKGTRLLINRGGKLAPLHRSDPRELTASLMRDFYVYDVKPGETCPCPRCGDAQVGRRA